MLNKHSHHWLMMLVLSPNRFVECMLIVADGLPWMRMVRLENYASASVDVNCFWAVSVEAGLCC